MIRSFALLCFLFWFASGTYAQDTLTKKKPVDNRLRFGFSLGTHFTQNSRDNNSVVFGLVLQHKGWMLNGGIKTFLDRVYGSDGTWLRFSGFNADLRYVFGKPENRFRFFTNLNADFLSQKYNGKVYDYPSGSTTMVIYDQEYHDKTLCFNAGAGMHLRIVDKLHLSLNAGAGCAFYAQKDIWKDPPTQQVTHYVNESLKDNVSACGLFSFGIFYVIN